MITERQWSRLIKAWMAAERAGQIVLAEKLLRAIVEHAHEWPVPDDYEGVGE